MHQKTNMQPQELARLKCVLPNNMF